MNLLARLIDRTYTIIAFALIAYMALSVLYLFQGFSEHYTNFIIGIVVCSLLLSLKNVLAQGKAGSGRFRGYFFGFKLLTLGLTLIVSIIVLIYVRLEAIRLETIAPFINDTDIVVGILFIAVLLIISWFLWGSSITILILALVLYFFYGHHIPGLLGHQYFDITFVVSYLTMSMVHGVYWFATIGADLMFLIIIFSGLLVHLGVVALFAEVGKALGRIVKGGAAFPAIFGSSMVAMIMGQAVANVALTGNVTIPLMKKSGFKPDSAGAVEAVASSGGQLTPPILGETVFMMAGILNLPYIFIVMASVIPAILYYLVVIISTLTYGYARNLPQLRVPIDTRTIYRFLPIFIIPFLVVIVLLVRFYTPSYAGLFGIVAIVLIYVVQKRLQVSLKELFNGFKDGVTLSIQLVVLGLAIGLFAQAVITTNFGIAISQYLGTTRIFEFVILTVLLAMGVSLLLGMGMPTPVAYIVVALTIAPLLIEQGIEPFRAHMFVFWFAVFSALTPPIALAALAATKISGAGFYATAREALKLAAVCFVIPWAFLFNPVLLDFPSFSVQMVLPFISVLLLAFAMASAAFGFIIKIGALNTVERMMFGICVVGGILYIIWGQAVYLAPFLGLLVATLTWVIIRHRLGLGVERVGT